MIQLLEILKDLVVRNFWLKLCAILLALVLWFVAKETGRTGSVPAEGHAQSTERKMNIRLPGDDMHSSSAAESRVELNAQRMKQVIEVHIAS